MVDDGDMAILWLGGDAQPSEMKDLLGVDSAHELPAPLPVSSSGRGFSVGSRL